MNKIEWNRHHTNCPNCKGSKVTVTDKAVAVKDEMNYIDDINTAKCDECGWKGMKKQLIESPTYEEEKKKIEELKVSIRTIDNNEGDGKVGVYLNGEDILAFIELFANKLTNALTDEDTINYTQNVLGEVFNGIMSTMVEHTKGRFKAAAEKMKNETSEATNK